MASSDTNDKVGARPGGLSSGMSSTDGSPCGGENLPELTVEVIRELANVYGVQVAPDVLLRLS